MLKKCVGLHLHALFHKITWSPCLLVNFISAAEKKVLRFSKAHFGLNNAAG
jgi:hypothetical protein